MSYPLFSSLLKSDFLSPHQLLQQHRKREKDIHRQINDILGPDDPLTQEIAKASQAWQQSYEKILKIIEKGKQMENLHQVI